MVDQIPILGPPLARMFEEVIPDRQMDWIKSFLFELEKRVQALQSQFDARILSKDEVIELVSHAMSSAATTSSKEKHEILAGLITAALIFNADTEELYFMLSKVETFSTLHLRVLLFMGNPDKELKRVGRNADDFDDMQPMEILQSVFSGVQEDVLSSVWEDLRSQRFVAGGVFGTQMSTKGVRPLPLFLSPLGKSFVRFAESGAATHESSS